MSWAEDGSGLEDEADGGVVGVPEGGDFAEGGGFVGEFEGVGWRGGEEVGDGLADLVEGGAAEAAAEELEAGAAEGGGGERDVGAGHVADLHVADARGGVVETLLRDGGEEGFGGRAPEVVEDDVDAVVAISLRRAAVRVSGDWSREMMASAPRLVSSARAWGLRPVAMMRRAPRDLAICTASWPETPVAPRMRTLSPGWNWARMRATAEDMAGLAMAAAVASGIASGRGMRMELEATHCSAKVPKGGRALPKRTRVPAGSSRKEDRRRPTPSTPGMKGRMPALP